MKCNSYHEQPAVKYLSEFEQGLLFAKNGGTIVKKIDIVESRCWGTKECDICSCGGDPTKCDFYPEKRKRAIAMRDTDVDAINELVFYRHFIHKYGLEYSLLCEYERWQAAHTGTQKATPQTTTTRGEN